MKCSRCGRDLNAIGQDNMSHISGMPLCEDCYYGVKEVIPSAIDDVEGILNKAIIAIDAGTEESAFCVMCDYAPISFGKIKNEDLMKYIEENYQTLDILVYENFQSYGMPVGQTTIRSIEWNGRYIQKALDLGLDVYSVYRSEEKMCLCKTMKAKDSNIRQALIDRFGDVGTKKNPGFFYGFKNDIWSAFAVGVTFTDKMRKEEQKNNGAY